MLLSHNELKELVNQGVITNVTPDLINATSIDLTLADVIWREVVPYFTNQPIVDLKLKENLKLDSVTIDSEHGYLLVPREFILASTEQFFNLPNDISCEYMLKSSLARNGLEHLHAGWCDAGWNGSSLTLEMFNATSHHTLKLTPGMKIGQVKFFRHSEVPSEASYATKGQYNGDTTAQPSKGLK